MTIETMANQSEVIEYLDCDIDALTALVDQYCIDVPDTIANAKRVRSRLLIPRAKAITEPNAPAKPRGRKSTLTPEERAERAKLSHHKAQVKYKAKMRPEINRKERERQQRKKAAADALLTPEQKLERNRLAVANYYNKNKDRINAERSVQYKLAHPTPLPITIPTHDQEQ